MSDEQLGAPTPTVGINPVVVLFRSRDSGWFNSAAVPPPGFVARLPGAPSSSLMVLLPLVVVTAELEKYWYY